jgi:4-hydroxybenzoate polyprenyltransferase
VFLGGALAASPIAACIAVNPSSLGTVMAVWCLSLMVLFWVAGFDVIYALQDLEFDRGAGLHSIPAQARREGSRCGQAAACTRWRFSCWWLRG